ncbi:hypothetical protein [uncultured Metabacillus sp.]|uniref:hypothetical protein n=1 Tax=uncultured Metabacillus sp. TaxID=2860135 RepID=UPI00261F7927|nr:hypothetical protein [uncultured Metabacillus sp.]
MEGLQDDIERLYSPGEVALHLDIERQTVTKYARIFEDNGYNFHKDEKGNRAYTDTNIMMFKDLINQRNKPGVTLESAAKSLVAIYKKKTITASVTTLHTENEQYNQVIDNDLVKKLMKKLDALAEENKEIKEHLKKQESFNKALVEQLQQFDRGSKERHNQLTQSLRESMENQKLIAAAAEEQKKEQKKGFFARLLGK